MATSTWHSGARTNAQRAVIASLVPGEVLVIDGLRNQGAASLGNPSRTRSKTKALLRSCS